MKTFSFRTIQSPTEGLYKEKGSKFLAFAFPVNTESAVKDNLELIRKQYFDARHHCYGYILGAEKSKFRAVDDGEPNHSAGDPILGQIRSKELTNVLVVVVRYFGGVKLGVGGLISAYKLAAEDALNKAIIVQEEVRESISLGYDYAQTPEVMRLVKEFELEIIEQDYGDICKLAVSYKIKFGAKLFEKIALLNATGTSIQVVQQSPTP